LVDFSTYQAPGVYIEEEQTPLAQVVGVQPTVIAIIGPALGYRINTETLVLTGTTPVTLAKDGIDDTTGFEVTLADGTVVGAPDYDVVQTGTAPNTVTTIARSTGSTLDDPVTVTVSYRYTDSEYFTPFRALTYDDARNAFGDSIDLTTGDIVSPLSLGAKVAFDNGAASLLLVPIAGTAATRAELQDAYATLATYPDVKIVVPLPVGMTGTALAPGDLYNIGQDLKTQVETASAADARCIGIIGWAKEVTIDPATAVPNFTSSRVMAMWPNRMSYFNGSNNTTFDIDGCYLAAAAAGIFAANQVQVPLTHKIVRGFAGIPTSLLATMTLAQKNIWSNAGVAVVEPQRDGRLIVRHGTSTDRTNVLTREISLTRAKDTMIDLVEDALSASQVIGTFIDSDTPANVQSVVQGALETAQTQNIIIGYQGLTSRQQSVDPSVIEIKFQYQPAYPLNYVVVSFSINTQTGEVSQAA
jgi:hypothetical protein